MQVWIGPKDSRLRYMTLWFFWYKSWNVGCRRMLFSRKPLVNPQTDIEASHLLRQPNYKHTIAIAGCCMYNCRGVLWGEKRNQGGHLIHLYSLRHNHDIIILYYIILYYKFALDHSQLSWIEMRHHYLPVHYMDLMNGGPSLAKAGWVMQNMGLSILTMLCLISIHEVLASIYTLYDLMFRTIEATSMTWLRLHKSMPYDIPSHRHI